MTVNIYTMSDLHVDYQGNFLHLLNLCHPSYQDAVLIVSGDVTDDLAKLEQLLAHFKSVFAEVFFVPGNHELWVRRNDFPDSVSKFWAVIDLCKQLGVRTQPYQLSVGEESIWIVPLFSWYTKPEEGADSLFADKPGDDATEELWGDNFYCRWSRLEGHQQVADYFLALNEPNCTRQYNAPVVSFSHFLPRQDLIFPVRNWREQLKHFKDPMPQFNFTRVAGTQRLDRQIRRIGSVLHIYGHQHRNRHRAEDGVTYVSHCLGYPKERMLSHWRGDDLPKLVWSNGLVPVSHEF